jgi:enoyl-CoA hydratase/carnithine racemase
MNCLYRLLGCGDWQTRLKKEGDQVGWPIDKELVFTARVVEAEESYRIGLLNHLVPREHPGAVNPTLSRRPHKARSGRRSGASIEQRSGNLQLYRSRSSIKAARHVSFMGSAFKRASSLLWEPTS